MWSALALTLMFSLGAAAQSPEDRAGAERAALDYLEDFYEGSTEKLRRGVRPDVLKFGFSMRDGEYHRSPMSFDETLQYATSVKGSGRFPGVDAPKRAALLAILDQTAWLALHHHRDCCALLGCRGSLACHAVFSEPTTPRDGCAHGSGRSPRRHSQNGVEPR